MVNNPVSSQVPPVTPVVPKPIAPVAPAVPEPTQPVALTPVVSQNSPGQEKKKNKLVVLVVGLLLIILLLFLANAVVPRVLMYFTRATNSPGQFSLANSYVFGSPLLAQANGGDKIRVTAFLLDDKGRGVPNTVVDLNVVAKDAGSGVLPQISAVQPSTDDFGRAVFEVFTSAPGQFTVVASVGGLEFPQTATLTFR